MFAYKSYTYTNDKHNKHKRTMKIKLRNGNEVEVSLWEDVEGDVFLSASLDGKRAHIGYISASNGTFVSWVSNNHDLKEMGFKLTHMGIVL